MYATKRSGFAMIMAIFIVVLVAMGGTVILSKAAKGSKTIADSYVRTQAELLASSAIEFAVMNIQNTDLNNSNNCIDNMHIDVQDADNAKAYNIDVNISYAFTYQDSNGSNMGCARVFDRNSTDNLARIDVTVTSDQNLTTTPVRVFKRALQTL